MPEMGFAGMLQTCTRCRHRRIKCDSLLPACANCARSDFECTFRDSALDEDIPRSYVKALNDRIQELSSQLALQPQSPARPGNAPSPVHRVSGSPSYILVAGPRQDTYLNSSFPSRITEAVFEVLSQYHIIPDLSGIVDNNFKPAYIPLDRSVLTPSTIRFLLARYNRSIRPQYDILPAELMSHDGLSLKKMRGMQKFQILMACAIAAARESYKNPSWRIYAQVCRDWANELIGPIISADGGDSLTATLLLLIYELAEPSRGLMWELLDVSVRTCLQLGWHRPIPTTDARETSSQEYSTVPDEIICDPKSTSLLTTLNEIKGSLQAIFNRPDMLNNFNLPISSPSDYVLKTYMGLFRSIYDSGQLFDIQGCPFIGDVAAYMERVRGLASTHPLVQETWLLFLPICIKHKQCIHCFQESDDRSDKGMASLRLRLMDAASHLLENVYRTTSSGDGFIPPIQASTRALISGSSIVVGISKQWTSPQKHVRDLVRCTEILSQFASHWEGGHNYLSVWRIIVDLVSSEPPQCM